MASVKNLNQQISPKKLNPSYFRILKNCQIQEEFQGRSQSLSETAQVDVERLNDGCSSQETTKFSRENQERSSVSDVLDKAVQKQRIKR